MMKIASRACALVVVLVQLLLAAPASAEQTVRVAVFHNAPLMDYEQPQRPSGIFIDVLQGLAAREHWRLEFVPGTFEQGQQRLERGEVDLMPNMAATKPRRQRFAFGKEPIVHTWGQIYARENSGISSILDLSGKRIVAMAATVQLQYFSDTAALFRVKPNLRAVPDYDRAIKEVLAGHADAVLMNSFNGVRARDAGLVDTAIMFNPYELYFAAGRDAAPGLLDAIDEHVRELKKDPTSVYLKSLKTLTESQRRPAPLPAWVKWAALTLVALTLMGLAWALSARRAARRLQLSEARQRQLAAEMSRIFDHSLHAICVLDADLRIVRTNPAAQELLGCDAGDIEGRSCLDFVPVRHHAAASLMLKRVRDGEAVLSCQAELLTRNGQPACVVWSALWSDAQQEMYWIGHDDTERRKLMRSLSRHSIELRAANRELDAFSQSVAHDLRSPVSTIRGFVGKVVREAGGSLSPQHLGLLQRSVAAAERMDALIEDLLRLARLSEQAVTPRVFDLAQMAREVAGELAGTHPHAVDFSAVASLPVHADPRLMRIALDNLLGNAWKFSVHTAAARIEFGCREQAGERVYFVRDNGAGFDMAYAYKLFAPFQRLHDAHEFAGTGIGLSIVHKVVSLHGGRIWAEGAPEQGAMFSFTLPPTACDTAIVPALFAGDVAPSGPARRLPESELV